MRTEVAAEQQEETDVVVVGYGGAGATSAIAAHDRGARVIVLEKMPSGGGTTRISGGGLFTPTSSEVVPYIEAVCLGATEKDVIQAFVENALQTRDWIREIGGEVTVRTPYQIWYPPVVPGASFRRVPGAEYITRLHIDSTKTESSAEMLWRLLSTNVDNRGIKVMTRTAAKGLVTNEEGEVIGVIAENAGENVLFRAKRAVILTCGGFEYNEAMKDAFLPCKPFYCAGNPGNTGDGIIMAQRIGAALWHMTIVEAFPGFKAPEYQATFEIRFGSERFIHVNRRGKRFCDETGTPIHEMWRALAQVDAREDTSHPGYPNIPAYAVFDDVTRRKSPLVKSINPVGYNRDYKWSSDNSKEIDRGWIARARTIGELADRISVDQASLENTVSRYNESCKTLKDADFGRSKETLGPIETPPFYAIELWPTLINTQGGPRRDKQARVLNWEGKPIPRLYAAGELGSIWGFFYNGGGNLAECLAFGRMAGRNAAAEKPWD